MLWFLLSLSAALTQATNDALSKHFFSELTPYEMVPIRPFDTNVTALYMISVAQAPYH
jgi:hypothetical protein